MPQSEKDEGYFIHNITYIVNLIICSSQEKVWNYTEYDKCYY